MTQKPNERGGRKRDVRFDDRPEGQEQDVDANEGRETKPKSSPSGATPGIPDYGDTEPGDPRHVEIEAQQPPGQAPKDR